MFMDLNQQRLRNRNPQKITIQINKSIIQKNKVDDKKKKQDSNRKISTPKGIVKAKKFENTPVKCILCGQSIEAGKMLVHKQNVHGEKPYSSSTVGRSPSSQWVQIYQGGLPGLGKRHR